MGKIYDVSMTIESSMITWPGDPPVVITSEKSIEKGDSYNASRIEAGTHTGTHVDAPRHFIADGASVDLIAPETLMGPARLFRLTKVRQIDVETLRKLDIRSISRVLFATENESLMGKAAFDTNYVSITEDGARYLADIGVKLVGIDYLSVARFHEGGPVHRVLLGAGVVIIEGLDLRGVPAGDYEIICAPLKIKGADGAPARVFLKTV